LFQQLWLCRFNNRLERGAFNFAAMSQPKNRPDMSTATDLLLSRIDLQAGIGEGAQAAQRYLSDLQGYFADDAAYAAALEQGNPVLYTTCTVEPGTGDGALHYGVARLAPGRIGSEYYMTKGHYHAWRPAAEVYIGLAGSGVMLLEDEKTEQSQLIPLETDSIVYVPGHTAHRTINTGVTDLVYVGIYPAAAGHDYGPIATRNFRKVVVAVNGCPTMLDRDEFLDSRAHDNRRATR
jgi:glucose-6-phosphate isomerase, archaeal